MRPMREGAALVGVGGGETTASAAATHVGHAHTGLWRTPTPYLFLGFALMMGLIAVALLVLVCTRRKPTGSSRRGSAADEAVERRRRSRHPGASPRRRKMPDPRAKKAKNLDEQSWRRTVQCVGGGSGVCLGCGGGVTGKKRRPRRLSPNLSAALPTALGLGEL